MFDYKNSYYYPFLTFLVYFQQKMKQRIEDFDYEFDPELIAQYPSEKRDHSRLLVLYRMSGLIEHRRFFEIRDYLKPGDVLVLNNTKVVPCRLFGKKAKTGGSVELLLIKKLGNDIWEVMAKGRVNKGTRIIFTSSFSCEVMESSHERTVVRFYYKGDWVDHISRIGSVPIPPYIKREPIEEDREWYQTVYAKEDGSIAAPTAGLHFTEDILYSLSSDGIMIVFITLHVGTGTFKPVKAELIEDHKMGYEWFEVGKEAVDIIKKARCNNGRIVAAGTTAVRALEKAAIDGELKPAKGETDLFIYPGFKFNVVDSMITNFHLPKSTLLMLVMAFAGRENILNAYNEAVRLRYRFYSYGDAMLII